MHMMEQRYVSVLLEDWDNEEELYRRIVKLTVTYLRKKQAVYCFMRTWMVCFWYRRCSKLIQFQDRNGITNEYQWNVYGSLVERKAGDLRNVYEYAPNGQLTAAIANGMDYRYSYDKDGLLLNKKASGRTLLAYTYYELDRKISQIDITGWQVRYRFDKSDQLVDVSDLYGAIQLRPSGESAD